MTTFTEQINVSGASPAYVLAFTFNGNSYSVLMSDTTNVGVDSADLETTLESMSAVLETGYTDVSLTKVVDTESTSVIYTPPIPSILVSLNNSTFTNSVHRNCYTNDMFDLYVELSEAPSSDVTLTLTASTNESRVYMNGSQSATTLTFTPGDWGTSQYVSAQTSINGIHNIGDGAGGITCTATDWTNATASFTWADG